ncbi:hypothetical protein LCGC14_1138870 [marine sediment metagenome]|uniref:Uncharacterized protein n=1 Tax=marine sediment metagenome TaxID=412755 RepID=A0A0F9MLU7_9ZZZZ
MKELIILGLGPTRVLCPYDKETWGVNLVYRVAKRLDRLFIFDELYEGRKDFSLEDLRKLKCPIMHKRLRPDLNLNLEVYPIHEIIKKFNDDYFTNAICYMIAYALYLGYEKIDLYGIDHIIHQGYVMEKGGVEHWVGVAAGRGVEVMIPYGSALCKTKDGKLYGYEYNYNDTDFRIPEEAIFA